MNNKQILFLFSFTMFLFFGQQVNAQRGGHHFDPTEALELTEEQTQEWEASKAAFKAKKTALKNAENKDRSAWKQLKAEQKQALHDILTPAQQEKLEAIKAERMAQIEEKKALYKEMKANKKAYLEENVQPVLSAQRAKLNQHMTATEIAYINQLRTEITQKKAEIKARKETQQGKHNGESSDKIEGKRHHKKGHKSHHHGVKGKGAHRHASAKGKWMEEEDRLKLEAIAKKYESQIDDLFVEIEPQSQQWKNDFQNMKEEMKPERSKDISAEKRAHMKECRKQMEGKKEAHKDKWSSHKRTRFLLMDTNNSEVLEKKALTSKADIHQTKVYPNPSITSQTLEFTTTTSGLVQIDIVDKIGNVIKTVERQQMPAGNNKVTVDVSDLKGYVFYYRITDEQGVSSTKFLVKQ